MRFKIPEEEVVRPHIEPSSILRRTGIAKARVLGRDPYGVSGRVGAAKGGKRSIGGLKYRDRLLRLAKCGST